MILTTTFQNRITFQIQKMVYCQGGFHLPHDKANGWAHSTEVITPVLHQQLPAPRTSSPVLDSRTAGQGVCHKNHTKGTSTAILAQLINSQSASGSLVSHQTSQQLSNHRLSSHQRSKQAESPWDLPMKKPGTYLHLPCRWPLSFSALSSPSFPMTKAPDQPSLVIRNVFAEYSWNYWNISSVLQSCPPSRRNAAPALPVLASLSCFPFCWNRKLFTVCTCPRARKDRNHQS